MWWATSDVVGGGGCDSDVQILRGCKRGSTHAHSGLRELTGKGEMRSRLLGHNVFFLVLDLSLRPPGAMLRVEHVCSIPTLAPKVVARHRNRSSSMARSRILTYQRDQRLSAAKVSLASRREHIDLDQWRGIALEQGLKNFAVGVDQVSASMGGDGDDDDDDDLSDDINLGRSHHQRRPVVIRFPPATRPSPSSPITARRASGFGLSDQASATLPNVPRSRH